MSKITPKNETPVSMFHLENIVFNPLVELLNAKGWTWKRGLTEACKLLVESHNGGEIVLADEQARRSLLERRKPMESAPPSPPLTAEEKQEKAREQMRDGAKARYGKGLAPLILGSARWDLPPHPAPWELSPGCDPATMTDEQMIDRTLQAVTDLAEARKRGETVAVKFVAHDDFANMHPCYADRKPKAAFPARPAPVEWEDPKVTARKLATEQEMERIREMHARAAAKAAEAKQDDEWC